MRRLKPRTPFRTPFGLWLDAINCREPEWLAFAGPLRWDSDLETLVDVWLSWPGHRRHELRWVV